MEYVEGTNLQQYLEMQGGSIPEDVARFIFQQLMVRLGGGLKKIVFVRF